MCDLFGASTPKEEPLPAAPTDNSADVGTAELKRKRAAAAAFGRESTIATTGAGVTGQAGVRLGASGSIANG